MMRICPTEAQLLQMFIYVLKKSIWIENSIVRQIVNTMIQICRETNLMLHMKKYRYMVNKDAPTNKLIGDGPP